MREVLNDVGNRFGHDAAGKACLAARAIGNSAVGEGEEGMVTADCDILACFNLRAALSDDDHAGAR